ncbi:MAG: hypothetical protein WD766_09595 [Gemmatimonadota bacterium]
MPKATRFPDVTCRPEHTRGIRAVRGIATLVFALGLLPFILPAHLPAQDRTLESFCSGAEIEFLGAEASCIATAQAVTATQPLLGILIAGGNPTLGTAGSAGLRLGLLPRSSAGVRLNVIGVRVPDILAEQIGGEAGDLSRRLGVPVPAVTGDLSIGVFSGIDLAPGLGGIGRLSVLGSLTALPFALLDSDGFDGADIAYGVGARLHLLDESFIAPGVSFSVVRRTLPQVAFGDVCPSGLTAFAGAGGDTEVGACTSAGDRGEFSFDLTDWSTRLVASKRLLGLGATVGIGHDSNDSDVGFGFRGSEPVQGSQVTPAFRISGVDLDSTRWTAFGNLSFSILVASVAAEAGWVQGDEPIGSFEELGSDFDPREGSWYGSLGVRLSL